MCSFFATPLTAEGVVSVDVTFMMATGEGGPVWVDREAQFAADAEEFGREVKKVYFSPYFT